jgi:hypothetical protein
MDRDRKTRILARTENARLEELLILFGCGDEIAPLDAAVKRKRLSRADRSVPLDPFRAGAAHVMQLRPITRRDEPAHNSPNKR